MATVASSDVPSPRRRRVTRAAGIRLLTAACAAVLTTGLVLGAEPSLSGDEEQVARLLSRLELVDLQARHLELLLEAAPASNRSSLGLRLADLYAAQLMARSEDQARYEDTLQRIGRLVEQVPSARTPSLEVMLLQADYFRGESLVTKWLEDRRSQETRQQAVGILQSIAPQLDRRQQDLRAAVEKEETELDKLGATEQAAARLRDLNRLRTVEARAMFFAAWSQYYWGVAEAEAAEATARFTRAKEIFREILGIGEDYTRADATVLGLESIWRARALIGLGLAEAVSGNVAASQACFLLLERSSAPADVRELSPYWKVQGFLHGERWENALEVAKPMIDSLTGSASQGRVSLCASLVRAGFGTAQPTAQSRALGMLGVTGLVKLRQPATVRKLLEKYQLTLDDQSGFHLWWLQGQQLLEKAEKSSTPADLTAAAAALSRALQAADVSADVAGASQCRYQLGWCQFRLEQWEAAAKNCQDAVPGLRATDAKTAVESLWLAFLSYQKLTAAQPRFAVPAVQVLREIQREFPDHEYAQRADYYASRLSQAGLPIADSIRNLERVPASSPDYAAARLDICRLYYEQWRSGGPSRGDAETKLRAAVAAAMAVPETGSGSEVPLRAALLGADVALQAQPPRADEATQLLERWTGRTTAVSNRALQVELTYRQLQMATLRGDTGARQRHADWISEHGQGSAFELPALIVVAKAIDDHNPTDSAARQESNAQGRQVYERIVAILGSDRSTLQSKKNAQVALSRLAHYAAATGDVAEAARALERLLAVFPDDSGYLRRAGLATFQQGDYGRSLTYWRRLVAGTPQRDESWHEAKYHQIACLAAVDRPAARAAWDQYHLLFPDGGPPAWRVRFTELQRRLE